VAYLTDEAGRVVVYRGVNFSGTAKFPPYSGVLEEADLDRLGDWGVTLVRFLVIWAAIEPEEGVLSTAYLDQAEAQVRRLTARGLEVFLDMHQDLFGEGFLGGDGAPRFACPAETYAGYVPKEPWFLNYASPQVTGCFDYLFTTAPLWDHYRDAFVAIASRLADDPRVIGYDLMNEPWFGSLAPMDFEPQRLMPFYRHVGAGLAAAAPGRRLFLEPSSGYAAGLGTSLPPFVAGEVYAPHYYPAANESQGYDGDRAAIDGALDAMVLEAAALGSPWLLGEAGIPNLQPGAAAYLTDLLDALDARFGSVTLWDYSRSPPGSFSLLDENGGEQAVVAAVVRPYAHRIAGRPLAMHYDPASRALEASWEEAGVRAPTEIVLPPRLYPAVRVTPGDPRDTFTHDAAAGRLSVTGHAAVLTHSVRVEPGP
jgi:endoglycosylceramidase